MFGIEFIKAAPTSYVLHYQAGAVKQEGAGLSFFYYGPTSTLVLVPLASCDVPFVFNEVTADFQAVTLQGQLTYRVADPRKLAGLLDFSVTPALAWRSEDPGKLGERLVNDAQILARKVTGRLGLREALGASDAIVEEVRAGLEKSPIFATLGIELLTLSLLSVRPTPEMARALEAAAREALQRGADEAVYARRNAAVEQERLIKETELNTEIAVEQKRRQIRETQMEAEIAVEQQRSTLLVQRLENDRQEADGRAYALRSTLEPLQGADWKTLMALSAGGGDPRTMIALAFRELAENAAKIGQLNITPELLEGLLGHGDQQ